MHERVQECTVSPLYPSPSSHPGSVAESVPETRPPLQPASFTQYTLMCLCGGVMEMVADTTACHIVSDLRPATIRPHCKPPRLRLFLRHSPFPVLNPRSCRIRHQTTIKWVFPLSLGAGRSERRLKPADSRLNGRDVKERRGVRVCVS